MKETIADIREAIQWFLDLPIYKSEEGGILVGNVLSLVFWFGIVFLVAWLLRHFVFSKLLKRTRLNEGLQFTVAQLGNYLFIVFGFLVVIQTAGVNLGPLALFAGALGVGLGFGLQNFFSNFISGLILLIERPIKVGDFVDLGEVRGRIQSISLRSTVMLTNDNISAVIPNSDFVSSRVVNWSHNNAKIRFRVPIGVSYGVDENQVEKALLEAAAAIPEALKTPPPSVLFVGFGDSSLNFEVAVWTEQMSRMPDRFVSKVNFEIYRKLREYEISIPFPQRDLNIGTGELSVRMIRDREESAVSGETD